jgi:hypothetical protein
MTAEKAEQGSTGAGATATSGQQFVIFNMMVTLDGFFEGLNGKID